MKLTSRTRKVAAFAGLTVALAMTQVPAGADPPTNSSFESPDIATPFQQFDAGSTDIPGWTIVSGSVDILDLTQGVPQPTADGDQALQLVGVSRGVIQQSFPTTAGTGYVISWQASNNCGATNTGTFSVQGAAVVEMSVPSASPLTWSTESTTFTGTGGPVLLQFAATSNTAACGLNIDNVNIAVDATVPVVDPEAAIALGGLGVAVAGYFVLRHRRRDRLGGAVV